MSYVSYQTRLVTQRDRLIRAAWLMYLMLVVGLMIIGLPLVFASLQTPCHVEACAYQLPTAQLQAMAEAGVSIAAFSAYLLSMSMLVPIMGLTLATVLIWRRSVDRMALSTALFFGTCTINVTAVPEIVGERYPALALPLRLFVISAYGFLPLFAVFPNGRFVPHWARWLALAQGALALSEWIRPSLYAEGTPLARLSTIWSLSYALATLGFQVYRYRQVADTQQRQQIKWVVSGLSLLVFYALGMAFVPSTWRASWIGTAVTATLGTFLITLLILAFWIALLRHHLFDIDLILNRMLVYGTLTGLVVGVYAVVVGGIGVVVGASGRTALPIVAAALIAILFNPLRERLQRGVSRLLYGRRDEPYAVLAQLGRQLEASGAPAQILAPLAATLGRLLRLPYVAITTADEMPMGVYGVEDQARSAPAADTAARVPLTYQGRLVGTLRLLPRLGEPRLSQADRRLLDDLTPHLGVAVHAAQVTTEVQRARARIVSAREEERRRLRRDLHDGLGPQLASQALTLDLAVRLLRADPGQAEALLTGVREQFQEAVSAIRELIYGLRPPALDDLGLLGAIRAVAERLAPDSEKLQIQVQALDDLPTLPAAVEVAAYRIAQEALTNVARHAHACSCRVRLSLEETASGRNHAALCLEIIDDGVGIAPERAAGVGLQSMRERAVELGGQLTVERASSGGTLVRTILPLPTMEGTV